MAKNRVFLKSIIVAPGLLLIYEITSSIKKVKLNPGQNYWDTFVAKKIFSGLWTVLMILCVTLVDQEDVFEDDEVVLLPEMASVLPFFFPNGRRL